MLYTTLLHIFQLDPWSASSIERGVTSPWDFSVRLFHCGDHQRINTTWMYTLASLAGISPAQLCLHFRWAAPLVQWSLQSDSLSPSLSPTSSQILLEDGALSTQQPPQTPPGRIISLQASCSPSSTEHHLRKHYIFQLLPLFLRRNEETSKNGVPPAPAVIYWHLIVSSWWEEKDFRDLFFSTDQY